MTVFLLLLLVASTFAALYSARVRATVKRSARVRATVKRSARARATMSSGNNLCVDRGFEVSW